MLLLLLMSKNQRKQPILCQQHQFSLTPLRSDVYFKQTVVLSYCKGRAQAKSKCQKNKNKKYENCTCAPVFNKDRNHATNSFILPQQQPNFFENSQKFKLEHECRVGDFNDEKSKMLIPKPKTKYNYCNACRQNYSDYLQHIQDQNHKASANKSKFAGYIRDLQRKYDKKDHMRRLVSKGSQNNSTTIYNISQSDYKQQELGRPTKRVKGSYSLTTQPDGIFRNNYPVLPINFPQQMLFSNYALNGFPAMPFDCHLYQGVNPYTMPNLQNMQNLQHMEQIQRIRNLQSIQNYQNFQNFQNIQNLNNYGFQNCMPNPFMCWNPCRQVYPQINHFNNPVVINLQQKQD